MFTELKKLVKDTTQTNGKYVAKDVRNWIAFWFGALFCCVASVKSAHVHNELAYAAAGLMLGYSIGVTGIKAIAQYKLAAATGAACDDTSTGADDADAVKPTAKADI